MMNKKSLNRSYKQLLLISITELSIKTGKLPPESSNYSPDDGINGCHHESNLEYIRNSQGLANRKPIRKPQSALPQLFDEVSSDPIAETRLDEPASEEEGDDDQPDDLAREGRESRGEGERPGDDDEGPRSDGERAEDETGDCGEEDGKELTALRGDSFRYGDGESEDQADGEGEDQRDTGDSEGGRESSRGEAAIRVEKR